MVGKDILMRTIEDKRKQLQCRTDAAIAKRHMARRLDQEAEEELVEIRIEYADLGRTGA